MKTFVRIAGLLLALLALGTVGFIHRTCSNCGREYYGTECPHCADARKSKKKGAAKTKKPKKEKK